MKILYIICIVSSLIFLGCFTDTDESKTNPKELELLWQYAYNLDGGAPSTDIVAPGFIPVDKRNHHIQRVP